MDYQLEESFEIGIRPKFLKEYIGQENIKKQLSLFLEASKKKKQVLDHILISGPPGLGKTTLAQIIANELGKNIVYTSGPILEKKGDIAGILSSLEEGDILFIDEIHRLNPTVEETLYPALEDFKLDIIIGKGTSSRSVRIEIPPFTLIGATTKTGLLTSPLLSRFGIVLKIDYYEPELLTKVILRTAKILSINITVEGANQIALRSRGTPRIANRLLKRVHDYAVVNNINLIDEDVSIKALEFLDIDENGLDHLDRKYLSVLIDVFNGKPVGLNTLSSALSESKNTIEEVIEPYLLREGFIQKTPKGRIPTEKALEKFKKI